MASAGNFFSGIFSAARHARHEILSATLIVLFLFFWNIRVTGTLSFAAATTLLLFVLVCLAYGRIFLQAIARYVEDNSGLPLQFLCGFFVFNSALFVLALLSPLGMFWNVIILAVIAAIGICFTSAREKATDAVQDYLPCILAILVSGAAATIWCGDVQTPMHTENALATFHTWQDTFIHVREISVFAQAHGINSIFDIKLAGDRAPIYHFASYLSPAAISTLSSLSAMDVYASFQLPFGIFLTGLAAFAVVTKIFGRWAGVAATVGVLLFPDAYQQGFGNRYLSYYFVSQVNVGMLYGTACASLAWLFMLDGCKRGRFGGVLLGYLFLAICLFYKAHIFVANSVIVMIYPVLFFAGLRLRWRLPIGLVLCAIFVTVVAYSQTIPRVPVLRFDGSGIGSYLTLLLKNYEPGHIYDFFHDVFVVKKYSKALQAVYSVAMLLLSTLGVWSLAAAVFFFYVKKKVPAVFLWLPVVVIANYLVMTMGLALDSRGVGTPDELLNRPLVWVYFVVAAWTCGAAYRVLVGIARPQGLAHVAGLLGIAGLGATAAISNASNLQTLPVYPDLASYQVMSSAPVCLVKSAIFVRDHSAAGDLVEGSDEDPRFLLTALSERQLFVGKISFGGANPLQAARVADLQRFSDMNNANEVREFAATRAISWFVSHPGDETAWPAEIVKSAVFECDGFHVYHFATRTTPNKLPSAQ
jgi:hypothetical protein